MFQWAGFGALWPAHPAINPRARRRDSTRNAPVAGTTVATPLVDQRPVMSAGGSYLAEGLVSGRYPVALGLRPKALAPFREKGLADHVAFLDLPDADFVPSTALLYVDRAPRPAAAKLFANWILGREGQTILTRDTPTNSARSDVAGFEPDGIGRAGTTYFDPDREVNYAHTAATQRLVNGLLGRAP